MHTLTMIISGFILLGCFWAIGRKTNKTMTFINYFIVTWLIITIINMLIGIFSAGYTFLEELPIFLLLFLIPSLFAKLLFKKEK